MVSWEPSFFSNNLHNKRVSYFLVVDNGKTSYAHHLPVRLAGASVLWSAFGLSY